MKAKLATIVALFALACASTPWGGSERFFAVPFTPSTHHHAWALQARICVLGLAEELSANPQFAVVRPNLTADSVVWMMVATERRDGGFERNGKSYGGYHAHDTLYISVQRLNWAPLIKHEFMHALVESAGEGVPEQHGLPWGLCEFL